MQRQPTAGTEPSANTDVAGAEYSTFAREEAEDRRVLRASLWGAVGIHLLLLLINFPAVTSEPQEVEEPKREIFRVQEFIYEPPPPPPKDPIPPRRTFKKPMPDPTPDDPEPIVRFDEVEPDIELPSVDADFLSIPTAPPPIGPTGPIEVGGDVRKPEKLHAPQPRYTEVARRIRVEGVVIVQAIIDREGDVTNVRVIKGLPMGLTEEAVKAIKRWKFQPATLNGKPVAVYFNLSVNFRLR